MLPPGPGPSKVVTTDPRVPPWDLPTTSIM